MLRGLQRKDAAFGLGALKRPPLQLRLRDALQPTYYAALVVRTMRKRALPCIMRDVGFGAWSRGRVSIMGRIFSRTLKARGVFGVDGGAGQRAREWSGLRRLAGGAELDGVERDADDD